MSWPRERDVDGSESVHCEAAPKSIFIVSSMDVYSLLSFSASSVKHIDIWGLDSNGERFDTAIDPHFFTNDQFGCVRFDAAFPPRSMLRYLVVTCPEGFLSTLTDFDVRGQSFVFS